MTTSKKHERTCRKGHTFYKTSDCLTCPICENENKPQTGFLSLISAPARRALQNAGITTLQQLAEWTESEIIKLHGMGPSTLPKLRSSLKNQGLRFKK